MKKNKIFRLSFNDDADDHGVVFTHVAQIDLIHKMSGKPFVFTVLVEESAYVSHIVVNCL